MKRQTAAMPLKKDSIIIRTVTSPAFPMYKGLDFQKAVTDEVGTLDKLLKTSIRANCTKLQLCLAMHGQRQVSEKDKMQQVASICNGQPLLLVLDVLFIFSASSSLPYFDMLFQDSISKFRKVYE